MKQYIWLGVILFVSAHASNNPFDLKDNLGKLEKDQAVLLGDLRKLAEVEELVEVDDKVKKESFFVPLEKENKVKELFSEDIEESSMALENELNEMSENDFKARENFIEETQLLTKEVKDAKLLQISDAKKEAERREIAAYEKQRAEKLVKKRVEESTDLSKEQKVLQEAKERRLARKEAKKHLELADAKAEQLVQEKAQNKEEPKVMEVIQVKVEEDTRTSVDDINVTREKKEAEIVADKAYEDAVKEMSQED